MLPRNLFFRGTSIYQQVGNPKEEEIPQENEKINKETAESITNEPILQFVNRPSTK